MSPGPQTSVSFFSFFLLAVLDSSLLVVVNCVYKLKQHMEAWVECVCVSANAFFFFFLKSCLFKARLSGCRLVSESLCEVIRSDGRMWEFGIKWVVAALKAASYLADGAESENPFLKKEKRKRHDHKRWEKTHIPAGLVLCFFCFCFKWQHWLLFYLTLARYPSIS